MTARWDTLASLGLERSLGLSPPVPDPLDQSHYSRTSRTAAAAMLRPLS